MTRPSASVPNQCRAEGGCMATAALVASGQMAAAYFMAHVAKGLLPIQNQGDAAVLLCFIFLYVFATGPGPWSIDGLLKGSSRA